MASPLHQVETYVSLAEGPPGLARDWATCRLALAAPDRYTRFPTGEGVYDIVLAAGPPQLVPSLIEALKTDDPVRTSVATSAAVLGNYGVLPDEGASLADAVAAAMREDGSETDLWLAFALARLGRLDARALTAAVKVQGPDSMAPWLLPVVVLTYAAQQGAASQAAKAIVQELRPKLLMDPGFLGVILASLGVPAYLEVATCRQPEEAVAYGAQVAGQPVPQIKAKRGSRKWRFRWWVNTLLEGNDSAPAAFLREVSAANFLPKPWDMWTVAAAAWLGTFKPSNPVDDVLFNGGSADVWRLSAARRSVDLQHTEGLTEALSHEGHLGAGVLAMKLRDRDQSCSEALLEAVLCDPDPDLRALTLGSVAAWHIPDELPEALRQPATRGIALALAEWVPTEEVLQALLEIPVPTEPDFLRQYAISLASMADPATVPTLVELLRQDRQGSLADVQALASDLLGDAFG